MVRCQEAARENPAIRSGFVCRVKDCPIPITENDSTGWLGREPTMDEQEILALMKPRSTPDRILHVGIGTGLFFKHYPTQVVQAITKDGGEASYWRERKLDTILCNKYDVASYASKLTIPFDCIIDVNIRSYACCDEHFLHYMAAMGNSLRRNGRLLTSTRGLDYLKPTTIRQLKKLCPKWRIRRSGNVVEMSLRYTTILTRVISGLN
jgi:hypothetical protein